MMLDIDFNWSEGLIKAFTKHITESTNLHCTFYLEDVAFELTTSTPDVDSFRIEFKRRDDDNFILYFTVVEKLGDLLHEILAKMSHIYSQVLIKMRFSGAGEDPKSCTFYNDEFSIDTLNQMMEDDTYFSVHQMTFLFKHKRSLSSDLHLLCNIS